MESAPSDAELIKAVLEGDASSFEPLISRYQPRVFGMARRYARVEEDVNDIAQEVFIKAYQRLDQYRSEAPFEHWLMRLGVRVCYDFLRKHQRNREHALADLTDNQAEWLDRQDLPSEQTEGASDARELVNKVLESLSPAARLVITLLEIEDRSIKEISAMTGWSVPLVKVRAFRARAEMRKVLERLRKMKDL